LKPRIVVSWSGGKDSALALWELRRQARFEPSDLLTTYVEEGDGERRVSGHGIPLALVERQAAELGIPLRAVPLPPGAPNEVYERRVGEALKAARARSAFHVAFGDLFLEEIREFRQRLASPLGVTALFPLWGRATDELAHGFVRAGFHALVVAADLEALPPGFAGRAYDELLLAELPPGVDPCGENGEVHTFVHGGPIFPRPLRLRPGPPRIDGRFERCEPILEG
jgi:uncharacterized protein (TIGR00290 family)